MVLEDFIGKIGKRKIYSLFLGILYVLISYGTAQVFFPSFISLTMIFLVTLLLVPSTSKLIGLEESVERTDGLHRFFKDHYILMEIFLFLFIGIFIGYLMIGSNSSQSISYQLDFLKNQGATSNSISDVPQLTQLINILTNNVSVIVVAFILSLFYGVGALFLIVLNASIFAGFILKFSQFAYNQTIINASLFSLHFIPEVFGFLLAAMAGGVISKALTKEKIGSQQFRNVVKDGTVLLLLALAIITIAAIIEVFLTPYLARLI